MAGYNIDNLVIDIDNLVIEIYNLVIDIDNSVIEIDNFVVCPLSFSNCRQLEAWETKLSGLRF